jgi:hypothetical protein
MILETPAPEQEIWAEEINFLYSMVGKEPNDPEILERERELQELGKDDRQKQLEAIKRKVEKAAKPPRKRKAKGKEEVESESENEEEGEEEEEHIH